MTAGIQFFIGKGGVGKSTISALSALELAGQGRKTLLVSMDPAHNQRDIFGQTFSETPTRVRPHLSVKEVDVEYWVASYLKDAEKQLKHAYRYQTAFNIHSTYKILRYSPGLEEYALLLAFEHILSHSQDMDQVLFDMPPTALTLRFFSLPFVTLIWLKELLKLRKQIYAKKEIVSKIKFGKKDIETDEVKLKLASLIQRHTDLKELFLSDRSHINLVLNDDRLSVSEAGRIQRKLHGLGIDISRIIINKVKNGAIGEGVKTTFAGYPISLFPVHPNGLYGLHTLEDYLCKYLPEIDFRSGGPSDLNVVANPFVPPSNETGSSP